MDSSTIIASQFWMKMSRFFGIVAACCLFIVVLNSHSAQARVQGWDPGYIISDAIFTNQTSMTAADIQSFLNSKVPTCDTWGTQTSEYGGGTRRQWAEAKGYSAPFTCLKDYSENGKTSAQIIYNVAQKYSINPQVLIVLLQKEQGLVTDDWPVSGQYKTATGYGCPDTAPCDSQYFGLTNQLDWAGKMYRSIMNADPDWYTPYILGNNYIRYSPDSSCGGSTVNIQNRATQALYNYTPYQPNDGTLNADWGTAPCGAYGNRNFYLYFTSWFGTTRGPAYAWQELSQKIYTSDSKKTEINYNDVGQGQNIYIEYTVKNIGYKTWPKNTVLLGRTADSPFCTNEWVACSRATIVNKNSDVKYGDTVTFGFWMRAPLVTGYYKVYWNLLIENVAWFNDIGSNHNMTVTAKKMSDHLDNSVDFMRIGDAIYSPNKDAVLMLLSTGKLCLYYKGQLVTTLASNVYQLRQQTDGNLVAYNKSGSAVWSIGDGNARQLTITDDGKLLYKKNSSDPGIVAASWQTTTNSRGETMSADQLLMPGQALYSNNNAYRLVLQTDGNLVQYGPKGAMWGVGSNRGYRLVQQGDGKLVLYDYLGNALWGSPTWLANGSGSKTYTQGDGNIVTYNNYSAVWALR